MAPAAVGGRQIADRRLACGRTLPRICRRSRTQVIHPGSWRVYYEGAGDRSVSDRSVTWRYVAPDAPGCSPARLGDHSTCRLVHEHFHDRGVEGAVDAGPVTMSPHPDRRATAGCARTHERG